MKQVIGVDIGGTYIKAGIVSEKGNLIKSVQISTEAGKGEKIVLENIFNAINLVFNKDISAIGVGCPGMINLKRGVVVKSPNLPFKNLHLKKIIKNKFCLPVFLDNDARCFALAESLYGAGKKHKTVVGLTIGTGLGGGIVIDKEIYRGKGSAGEIGHMMINFNGPKCSCGSYGCLEEYVSARAIMRNAKGLIAKNPLDLSILAKNGNKKAIKVFKEAGTYLGIGISNIINSLDPEIIVVGGKIANSWPLFRKKMEEEIKRRAVIMPCRVVRKKLSEPGIIGAAAVCLKG